MRRKVILVTVTMTMVRAVIASASPVRSGRAYIEFRNLPNADVDAIRKQLGDKEIVLDNAYYLPGLWWSRNLVQWTKVKNYIAPPNHYTNQKLQDVWLSED